MWPASRAYILVRASQTAFENAVKTLDAFGVDPGRTIAGPDKKRASPGARLVALQRRQFGLVCLDNPAFTAERRGVPWRNRFMDNDVRNKCSDFCSAIWTTCQEEDNSLS